MATMRIFARPHGGCHQNVSNMELESLTKSIPSCLEDRMNFLVIFHPPNYVVRALSSCPSLKTFYIYFHKNYQKIKLNFLKIKFYYTSSQKLLKEKKLESGFSYKTVTCR